VTSHRDARSLDHTTLEEMRRLAVSRVEAGESQVAVAASLQVHYGTVWKWVAAYRAQGAEALASRPATGRPPTLDEKQMQRLRREIVGKNPRQLGFGMALCGSDRRDPRVRDLVRRGVIVGFWRSGSAEA
jgi:transposase